MFELHIRKILISFNREKFYKSYLNIDYAYHLKNNSSQYINNIMNITSQSVTYIIFYIRAFKDILLLLFLIITLLFVSIKISFSLILLMSAISGLNGLEPTLTSIKYTKRIAIANKESLICAWNLIQKKLKLHKTEFIPVDSEHFSIWSLIKNTKIEMIDKIYITASGGPFLKMPVNKLKTVTPKLAINTQCGQWEKKFLLILLL